MARSGPRKSVRPEAGAPRPAPTALRDLPVVVVGAGPVGSLCAVMLAQRGLRVTVIDRLADTAEGLTARSWTVALNGRAERVLCTPPGLLDRVKEASVESRSMRVDSVEPDGSSKVLDLKLPDDEPPFRWILRPQLIHLLKDYANTGKHNKYLIDWRFGITVTGASFNADGTTTLHIATDVDGTEKQEEISARLVIACDGRRSPILAALRADTSGNVASRKGFAERSWRIPSSNKMLKSIVISKKIRDFVRKQLPDDRDWPDSAGYMLAPLTRPRRPLARTFAFGGLSTTDAPGGPGKGAMLASAMVKQDSAYVTVRGVADAYTLFDENFPHVNLREFITEESMREFVDCAQTMSFGPVRRPASIVGIVGGASVDDAHRGAIVLAGDAAHSFPPDLGQGLNTGIEDIGALTGIMDQLCASASVCDLGRGYDAERDRDVEGVIFLHRFGARWQFGQPPTLDGIVWLVGTLSRVLLNKIAPFVFKPPAIALMGQDIAFGEAMRQAQSTTRRIWACVGAIAVVVIRRVMKKRDV